MKAWLWHTYTEKLVPDQRMVIQLGRCNCPFKFRIKKITTGGVRTHADIHPLDLKSNALTTRPPWSLCNSATHMIPRFKGKMQIKLFSISETICPIFINFPVFTSQGMSTRLSSELGKVKAVRERSGTPPQLHHIPHRV